ncbi:chymotrypsin-like elastase family member 2B [Battus philenor]|uniref:chymotrypsin-like elastase family member 2B n=1 Tax=Battus philenor TaxID=42288 RepID=UPI0035CEC92D
MKPAIFIFLFVIGEVICQGNWKFVGNPLIHAYPCKNVKDIIVSFEPGLPEGRDNVYSVYIDRKLPPQSEIDLKTDSDAIIKFADKDKGRLNVLNSNTFNIRTFNETNSISFAVKGPSTGGLSYIESIKLNSVELCKNPRKNFLKKFVKGADKSLDNYAPPAEFASCGRRKVLHTELIVGGEKTKAGDWPWHVAIYRLYRNEIKYICGGTLLSTNFVLTAAHCASIRGQAVIPEILNVVLGKHNLVGGDVAIQEKEVFKIILHERFNYQISLDNDIALLKLRTEVTFTDYVQPACLWNDKALDKYPAKEIFGTVIGWGFDQTNELSTQLRQASMPIVPENICYKSNPLFYAKVLNDNKFCAGSKNGTSACNGDSGGGFFVFSPDARHSTEPNAPGSWFLKGIVSLTVSKREARICDPTQYVVFTDVAKYKEWICKYVEITF